MAPPPEPHDRLAPAAMQLLRERAERLARPLEEPQRTIGAGRLEPYLCLRTLGERYGLPLAAVWEVIQLHSILDVPGTPGHVVGLVRLRGRILTLVDLRRFWQVAEVGLDDADLAVVIRVRGVDFGVVCSEAEELIDLDVADIQQVPDNLPVRMRDSLHGLARREILLIDPERLIEMPGFLVGHNKNGNRT